MIPRTLYGYVLRRLALTWIGMLALLTVIMTVGQLPAIMNRAAEHEIAPQLIAQVLLWMMLANAPILIIITLTLAITATLGRLGSNNELTAMAAAGISPLHLLAAVMMLAAPVIALQGSICLQFAPQAFCKAVQVRGQAARNLALAPIHAGQFLRISGSRTLFVGAIGPAGELREVFATSDGTEAIEIITAARGRVVPEFAHDRVELQLFDGQRYTGVTGQRRFQIVTFRELSMPIALPASSGECTRPDARGSGELWRSTRTADLAELDSRVGFIVMTGVLVLIALALSRNRPRKSAYSNLAPVLGVFIVYLFVAVGIAAWSARNPGTGRALYWGLHGIAATLAIAGF